MKNIMDIQSLIEVSFGKIDFQKKHTSYEVGEAETVLYESDNISGSIELYESGFIEYYFVDEVRDCTIVECQMKKLDSNDVEIEINNIYLCLELYAKKCLKI